MPKKTSVSSVLLFFLLLIFALSIIFIFRKTRRIRKRPKYPLPPGPTSYPMVGCLPEMVRCNPTYRWMHNCMRKLNTEIACFRLGRLHVITVTSPELSRKFLKEQDAIFASRPEAISARLTSNGYLSAVLSPGGDQWKKMKRVMVSEVLNIRVHEQFHAKRCEEADHLIRYVHNRSKKGVVNVREAARLYCGGVIRKMVFGKRFFRGGERNCGPGIEDREHVGAMFTILWYLYGFAIGDCVPLLEMAIKRLLQKPLRL